MVIKNIEEDEYLEVRPEYLEKLERIKKGKFIKFNSIEELRKLIEST